MTASKERPPFIGFGLGLRSKHYTDILEGTPPIDWFEILSENYMVPGGKPLAILDRITERYPVVMHGVSLSIASTQPLDMDYLKALKSLAARTNPKWISDHLCWTGVHGVNLHDLLPFPYTEEALDHISERVNIVQDYLGRPFTLENVSTYVSFNQSEMKTLLFYAAIFFASVWAKSDPLADCQVCLDTLTAISSGIDASSMDLIAIEDSIEKFCSDNKSVKTTEKLCYFIKPIKREISQPLKNGVPVDRICKRLKKKSAEICAIRPPVKVEKGNTDYSKMRVKQLKKVLSDRGVTCENCLEKSEFVKMCYDTEHMEL